MGKVVLGADSLDGYLTEKDQSYLARMDGLYARAMDSFKILAGVFQFGAGQRGKKGYRYL
jgi:uracil phosphoribosyltransferase